MKQKIKWNDASISVRHSRMRKRLASTKPLLCPICGKDKVLELSNKDHQYHENIKDWQYICHKCHRAYDTKNDNYQFYKIFNSLFIE